ncbi:MAG TPA: hypothetical protein ENK98_01560 [Epsilonproteobacteria bacterium]|nr:hypothetical protein [Campylobacterota bacterium]
MKGIIISIIVIFGSVACNNLSVKNGALDSTIEKMRGESKITTILGTYAWDVETNTQGSSPKSDFWLEWMTASKGSLVAQNGTTVEVVKRDFDSIDKKVLQSYPAFRDGRIDNDRLKVGTVAFFKTSEGHYGELKIIGFKALHDFDFKEAQAHLDPSWKRFVLAKPNRKKYHLVVKYRLYR